MAVCFPVAASAAKGASEAEVFSAQQGRNVTVIVSDELGAVPGAGVVIKGTQTGGITDENGRIKIPNVPNGATLEVSFIGYKTQEIVLAPNQTTVYVTLSEDNMLLNESVVVGYGTQSKKDITGSIAVVDRDELAAVPVASVAEALQGKAAGVYVSTTGAPGAGTTIRIRGVGSVNGSDPLIVVDGVSGVDLTSVNPNDIESFQVLKDASATAIYGAKGANGVIIVTTKQGSRSGQVRVSYNGYAGIAQVANKGFSMLDAWESMEFVGLGMDNAYNYRGVPASALTDSQFGSYGNLSMPYAILPAGQSQQDIIAKYGSVEAWEAAYKSDGTNSFARSAYYQMLKDGYSEAEARKGTDWYKEIMRTGHVQNHELSLQGGNDKGMYSVSVGYSNFDGTVKNSSFERFTLRSNATFNPTKHITIGENINMSAMNISGERGGAWQDQNALALVYMTQPWVPVYNVGGEFAGSTALNGGRSVSAAAQVARAKGDWTRNARIQAAIFAEIKDPWIQGLSIRSQFSTRLNGGWGISMSERNNMDNKEGNAFNSFSENANWSLSWQWTNTATYTKTIQQHKFTIMAGSEALKEGIGRSMNGGRRNYTFESDPNTWTLSNGRSDYQTNGSSFQTLTSMFGLFARADYSYMDKYLATVTVRRDASSKFSSNHRWGTFPSVSLGWRVSNESFMKNMHWINDLKLRAGYGSSGNSNIGAYNWAYQYVTGVADWSYVYNYPIDGSDSGAATGYGIGSLGDLDAKWETTKMLNVGYDLTAFDFRLTSALDFYIKTTDDMLVPANFSSQASQASKPNMNIGSMKNVGIDFSLGWNDKIGDFGYNINTNLSWYRNTVTKLGSSNIFGSHNRISNTNITTVGQPIGMFYGYQVDGIYTSVDDVMAYGAIPYGESELTNDVAQNWVGRYRFKDVNNDHKIDADDRTFIGNPHPDLTGGVNLGLSWKNWDLSTYLYFSLGNDLFKAYEYFTMYGGLGAAYSARRRDLSWSPTSNPNGTYPMWAGTSYDGAENTSVSHSNYVEDGSYLRMQTLTLGYSLPHKISSSIGLQKVRFYLQGSNLFTVTRYSGLDPEVMPASDISKGIDSGSYGMPRQILLGVNIQF